MTIEHQLLTVTNRGHRYEVGPFSPEAFVLELQEELKRLTGLALTTMKLLIPGRTGFLQLDSFSHLTLEQAG